MTLRLTRPKRPEGDFTEAHARQLLGIREGAGDFFSPPYGQEPEGNSDMLAIMRRHWLEHKDELLSAWIAEKPRTRPYAWWLFSAPELRKCVRGKRPKFEGEWAWAKNLTYMGMPRFTDGETYETEENYLHRLNLLTPSEMG